MIKQAEKSYAPLEVERQVQEFWSRTKAYQKTVATREKGKDFADRRSFRPAQAQSQIEGGFAA